MTGKLIKYEIRSSVKLIAVIWAALITASILFSIVGNVILKVLPEWFNNSVISVILAFAAGIIYFALFTAMIVVTIMIVILRFYRGLLGNEGYLMHTLPVKPWQLITSKGVVSAGVVLISIIAAILSITIMAVIAGGLDIAGMFRDIAQAVKDEPQVLLIGMEILIVMVATLMKWVYQIYASLSIGQLAGKHRILLSLGAYIGINVVLSVIGTVMIFVTSETSIMSWIGRMVDTQSIAVVHAGLGALFFITAVQLAAFHVITERILSRHLNLQ